MIISSSAFEPDGNIPKKFTCDGGNISPELLIQNVPEEAKSLALILHDPDAPREGGFTHWVVWNIDPRTAIIKQESIPPGSVEGRNGAGKTGYIGPCPPSGIHHYHFQLYALNDELDLPAEAPLADVQSAIDEHLITQTDLVGLYERVK